MDAPWHIETLRLSENDERRYQGRCKWYSYERGGYCLCRRRICHASTRCSDYVSISEEDFRDRQKQNQRMRAHASDPVPQNERKTSINMVSGGGTERCYMPDRYSAALYVLEQTVYKRDAGPDKKHLPGRRDLQNLSEKTAAPFEYIKKGNVVPLGSFEGSMLK